MVVEPSSVCLCLRPHFQQQISPQLVSQLQSNFIRSIIGVGKRWHKVLGQVGSEIWFPWQQLAPIGYNGKNVVNTLAPTFLIGSSSFLQVTRKTTISWMSLPFSV